MKNYILLLLLTITAPLYSQIKVSGGVMGEAPTVFTHHTEQEYSSFESGDVLTIIMTTATPIENEVKSTLVLKNTAEHNRESVSVSTTNMNNDIVVFATGRIANRIVPCRFSNAEEYEGAKFDNDVLQTNVEVPLFIICRKELFEYEAIKELIATHKEYDMEAIREQLDNAGLGEEYINIVYSKIVRNE